MNRPDRYSLHISDQGSKGRKTNRFNKSERSKTGCFNRLVFYEGASPHTGHISHPELLSDDLSKGRLTLNFFSTAHAR
jgi:hypothetical protein